jgi:PadR family transcriptional regulator, regulatory protein PadR
MAKPTKHADVLQGTLNMLVLQVLARGRANGYEIAKRIEERSEEALAIDHGSLYPALRRMEASGWIEAAWELSPTNRKARYYSLTQDGRNQIRIERARWQAASVAVARIMGMA